MVTIRPTSAPMYLFRVSFSTIFFSLLPAAISRPSPISFMPYRNRPRPPRSIMTSEICMLNHSPHSFSFDLFIFFTKSIVTKKFIVVIDLLSFGLCKRHSYHSTFTENLQESLNNFLNVKSVLENWVKKEENMHMLMDNISILFHYSLLF